MMDAALVKECADPSLKPAIVEQFVTAVGSVDPLSITVKSGDRLILVPKAKTPEEAIEIIRQHVGGSVVRVGLTQFPAGLGAKDASEVKTELVEACSNLRMGTTMFAKVLRIVARWYGNPTSDEVFPQLFDDAVLAWKTGEFEGDNVFRAQDPGGTVLQQVRPSAGEPVAEDVSSVKERAEELGDPERAGIRVDLSRIGGR